MPICVVVGCPPVVALTGPQKVPLGVDELGVAGTLAGAPIRVARAHSLDLLIPAESELVIEGYVERHELEPEGPFGESHGYVALEEYSVIVNVTAITRRRDAVLASMISQVTPCEIERHRAPRLRAAISGASARHARREGHSPRIDARAADKSAARRDPAIRARIVTQRDLARAAWDGRASGGDRQVRDRGRRGHRSRERRCGVLGHVVPLQSDQGHAYRRGSRARTWPAHERCR